MSKHLHLLWFGYSGPTGSCTWILLPSQQYWDILRLVRGEAWRGWVTGLLGSLLSTEIMAVLGTVSCTHPGRSGSILETLVLSDCWSDWHLWIRWFPRNWTFSEDLILGEGGGWGLCQPEQRLVSQKAISHNSNRLYNHLEGKTRAETTTNQDRQC